MNRRDFIKAMGMMGLLALSPKLPRAEVTKSIVYFTPITRPVTFIYNGKAWVKVNHEAGAVSIQPHI